jgi:hypothetical protein
VFATAIFPVAGFINGPVGVEVNFTCPGSVPITVFAPFKVSLSITLAVFSPW